ATRNLERGAECDELFRDRGFRRAFLAAMRDVRVDRARIGETAQMERDSLSAGIDFENAEDVAGLDSMKLCGRSTLSSCPRLLFAISDEHLHHALQRRPRVLGCVSRIVTSSLEVARESFGGLSITAGGRTRDTRSIREIGPGVPDPSVPAAIE